MLTSIHPLGERARHNRWWLTASAFVVGGVATATAIGLVLGWLGSLLPGDGWRFPAAIAITLAAGAADLGRVTVPGPRRQVNEDWIGSFRGWVYGGGFGAQLGAGAATYVVTWGVWAMFALMVLTGDPIASGVVGAVFGIGRSVFPLAAGWIDRPSRLTSFSRAMSAAARPVARGVGIGFVLASFAAGAWRLL